MKDTFKMEVELPLKYHGTFALIVGRRGFKESVNDLLVEYITQNKEVKDFQEWFDKLPDLKDIKK